ncbi:MAG: hypothetical protein V1866_03415 [archaeon]
MNKNIASGILILSIMVLLAASVFAETAELKDTKIDYVAYRELVAKEPGVVYQIKIANLGASERSYELIPDTDAIRSIGSYRIDPSYILSIKPNEEKTAYFYLAIEKDVSGRKPIKLEIKSGQSSTTLNLVARAVGPFNGSQTNVFAETFKIVFSVLLIIILLIALVLLFRRVRPRKEKKDKSRPEDEVETYY